MFEDLQSQVIRSRISLAFVSASGGLAKLTLAVANTGCCFSLAPGNRTGDSYLLEQHFPFTLTNSHWVVLDIKHSILPYSVSVNAYDHGHRHTVSVETFSRLVSIVLATMRPVTAHFS